MYSFLWDERTGGYRLTTRTEQFIAQEIRPVFAEELALLKSTKRLEFDRRARAPLLWARQTTYFYRGKEIAKLAKKRFGEPLTLEYLFNSKQLKLKPVDVPAMVSANEDIMRALIADTLKRIKEMYDSHIRTCDAAYIGFSGGKDSVVLLDLCHRALPLDVPVVFSDTDMELPDTYKVWTEVQKRYSGRPFMRVSAETSALENWQRFGPPSQALRWCCSVHKSTPAILALKNLVGKAAARLLAFVGVRGEESLRRSGYDDIGDGLKSKAQVNAMPILSWSAHELFLYLFGNELVLNDAYRKGVPRVGCLLCPMSSDRQNELIRINYGEMVSPFLHEVSDATERAFSSQADEDEYVFSGGWYARKSGTSLKDVIDEPGIKVEDGEVTYDLPSGTKPALKEWMKTIGKPEGVTIRLHEDSARVNMICCWESGKIDRSLMKWFTRAVHKAMACVGCRTCEVECPVGALRFGAGGVMVNGSKCIHCMKCHSPEDGCLRYYSKRYAGGKAMTISGINKYMTFGLKPEWIEELSKVREQFRATTFLGNRMIPSAVTWFREAGLIGESTAITPTRLLAVGEKVGFRDSLFWSLLWMRLANVSPLVRWYVCTTQPGERITLKDIDDKLSQSVSSASVRKGAIQSLCQMLKSSPLGEGEGALVRVEMKGRTVAGLQRIARNVDPLVGLFGLYVMAEQTKREAFTVRELMTMDVEKISVSPLSAFGTPVEEFKAQCRGLSSKYADFLMCNFTLGLDELRLFPEKKKLDDVVALILEA